MSEQCMICSLPAPDGDDWQSHHDRIAGLQRQLDEAQTRIGLDKDLLQRGLAHYQTVRDERDRYKAQLERRRGALEKYGQHDEDCRRYQREFKESEHCHCGLAAAIAAW